jgi:hypothetical protein
MWEISHCEGWHLILAGGILDGGTYIWPDPMLSEGGRQMLEFKALRDEINTHGIGALLDF